MVAGGDDAVATAWELKQVARGRLDADRCVWFRPPSWPTTTPS